MNVSKEKFNDIAVKQGNRYIAKNVATRDKATAYGTEKQVFVDNEWIPLAGESEKHFVLNNEKVFVGVPLIEEVENIIEAKAPKKGKAKIVEAAEEDSEISVDIESEKKLL